MKQTTFRILGVVTLAAVLAGCQSEAPLAARQEQYDYPWLMVGSKDLRASTMVSDARRSRDDAGLLHVSVPIRNVTDKQLYVDYRVTFYDRNQMPLPQEYRNTLTIPARTARDAKFNSTSPKAETFQMEITYPRVN